MTSFLLAMTFLTARAEPPALSSGSKVATGTLTYPALDNVDFREGTLEFWVKMAFDPAPYLPAKDYQGFMVLAALAGESGGLNLHYSAPAGSGQPALWCSIGPKTKLTPFGTPQCLFHRDEWHHVALTWKGCDMALFLDGNPAGRIKQNEFLYRVFGDHGSKPILFGDIWNVVALMVLDDFRLSRVARPAEELGFHGELKPDVYTSILDPFEGGFDPDGKTLTSPRALFRGGGGLPTRECCFAEGRFGNGLAFFRTP